MHRTALNCGFLSEKALRAERWCTLVLAELESLHEKTQQFNYRKLISRKLENREPSSRSVLLQLARGGSWIKFRTILARLFGIVSILV